MGIERNGGEGGEKQDGLRGIPHMVRGKWGVLVLTNIFVSDLLFSSFAYQLEQWPNNLNLPDAEYSVGEIYVSNRRPISTARVRPQQRKQWSV